MVDQTGRIRRRLVIVLMMLVVLFAGAIGMSATASAGWCTHADHSHPHNGHSDFYHFHSHIDDIGAHWHNWHNHTHGQFFTEQC